MRDLLLALPFDWEEFGAPASISDLVPGKQATVIGVVEAVAAKQTFRRRMRLTEATIRDDQGARLRVVWFNQPFIAKSLQKGDRLAVAGTPKAARYGAMLEM